MVEQELSNDPIGILEENNLLETNTPEKSIATQELLSDWKKYYLKEGHSVHSMITYYNYIFRFVGKGTEINQKVIDRFMNKDKNSSGACGSAIKNFIKFLVRKKGFPMELLSLYFEKTRSEKKMLKYLDPLEVQKLIDSIDLEKDGITYKLLTKTIYELALRVSEALKLQWNDFNWVTFLQDRTQKGMVNLKNTKGNKFRAIPISSELMNILYEEHKSRSGEDIPTNGLVFKIGELKPEKGKTIEQTQYEYIVVHAEDTYRKWLYKKSLEVLGKRINPHQLRHAKAMYLINKGMPIESIKELLGHSSINSTQIYAKINPERLKKDLEKYDN